MKRMKHLLILIAFGLLSCNLLFSQTNEQPWAIGLHGNITTYQGDLGNYWFDFSGSSLGPAVTATRYLSPFFDVRARISYSGIEIYDENGTYAQGFGGYADLLGTPNGSWGFDGKLLANTINLIFKFNNGLLLDEDAPFTPYLIAGFGETRFKTKIRRNIPVHTKKYHNQNIYYGLGFKYTIQEKFNIEAEVGFHNNSNDDLDGLTATTASGWSSSGSKVVNSSGSSGPIGSVGASNDDLLQFSLGVTYNLGKVTDSDNDGVSDKKDQCPNTPSGVEVDKNGCPLDRDNDGVADYIDACPDVKGTVKGCPDKDGDKIADKNDKCPNKKGPRATKGCPDSDGDGIVDKSDKCPHKKGPRANNGCPYPDSDRDGVADKDDKCPNVKGTRSNNGCPEVKKPKLPAGSLSTTVYFDTNSSYVKSQYRPMIDNLINLMKTYRDYNLSVEAHTDNLSSDPYNLKLSQRRANAVKKYVVKKGISANRIKTNYFGEKKPVANNKTSSGRKQNRRADLRLIIK